MIERYTRPEMAAVWADQRKYEIWLEIETLACEAQAEIGVVPKEDAETIRVKARFVSWARRMSRPVFAPGLVAK